MTVHAFCPHCGYDLKANEPVILNDFSMFGPGHPLCYRGKPLQLTHHEAELCWTLMKAYPAIVRPATILDRLDSDGGTETVIAFISKIKRKLADLDVPNPIENVRHSGYKWRA